MKRTTIFLAALGLSSAACQLSDSDDGFDRVSDDEFDDEPASEPSDSESEEQLDPPEGAPSSEEVEWDFPVASVELPNGNVLDFYASEIDGGVGVVEQGQHNSGSILSNPLMESATPLDVFLAVTGEGTPIPEGLLASNRSDPDDGELDPDADVVTELGARSRGWALEAWDGDGLDVTDGGRTVLAPSFCDSSSDFADDFFSPNGTTYNWWWGWVNTTLHRTNDRKARNWRGGQCAYGTLYAVMAWKTLNGSCNTTGSDNYVWLNWLYNGGWIQYTWLGANRWWHHYRYPGGRGHIGNKWKNASCL